MEVMNEKIKELAEQAGFMDGWFSESGDDCEQELRNFVELIVNHCLGIYDAIDNGNLQEGTDCYQEAVIRRFGMGRTNEKR